MKKLTLALALVFCLSTFAFADGHMTAGGKTCTAPCFASTEAETSIELKKIDPADNDLFSSIIEGLIEIFN